MMSSFSDTLEEALRRLKSDVRLIAERMEQGFLRVDERFKGMERLNMARFEEVDRRFVQQNRMMFAGFTVLALLMSIYEFVG